MVTEGLNSYFCSLHYGQAPEGQGDPERYAKILVAIGGADGEMSPDEWAVFEGIGDAMGASSGSTGEAIRNFDHKNANFEDLVSGHTPSRALLWDALCVAGGDGVFSDRERTFAHKAAEMLGIEPEVLGQMEALLEEEYALRERKGKLLFPNGQRV